MPGGIAASSANLEDQKIAARNLSDDNPVGAWLAREEYTAVFQVLRVIVLRGQATLPQVLRLDLLALGQVRFSRYHVAHFQALTPSS
jgi:hypothetical protein